MTTVVVALVVPRRRAGGGAPGNPGPRSEPWAAVVVTPGQAVPSDTAGGAAWSRRPEGRGATGPGPGAASRRPCAGAGGPSPRVAPGHGRPGDRVGVPGVVTMTGACPAAPASGSGPGGSRSDNCRKWNG